MQVSTSAYYEWLKALRHCDKDKQGQSVAVGRFKTRRIMRELKLQVCYPNRLDRQFQVAKPNQVWTTDITYV